MGSGLHHSRDQEDLVVRRQAVDDRHDEHQYRTHQRTRREVEQVRTETVDEHPGEDAQRGAGAEQVHDHGLRREDHRTEDQRQQDERRDDDVQQHPRQLAEERVDRLDLHRRGTCDEHLGPVDLDVAQFIDNAVVVVPVGDAGGEHRHPVLRGLADLELAGEPPDRIGLLVHLADRRGAVVLPDDQLDRVGAQLGEVLVEVVLGDTGGVVRRQEGLVDTAELHPAQRDGQQQQDAHQADGEDLGVPHREGGDASPPGVDRVLLRPAAVEKRPLVDVAAEQGEDTRQHDHGQQSGQTDRGDRAVGHGLQESLREQQQTRQCHRHHQCREDHRLSGGRGGVAYRGAYVASFRQFLPVPGDHEQAVVDRQAQTQQRHHRLGEGVDHGDVGQQGEHAHRAEDRQHTDEQRHTGRDDRTEDEDEQQGDRRQSDDLGAGDVVAHAGVQGAGDRRGTGDLHGRTGHLDGVQGVLDLPVVFQDLVLDALQGDRGEGGGAVVGDQLGLLAVEVAEGLADLVRVGGGDRVELAGEVGAYLLRAEVGVRVVPGDQQDDVTGGVASEDVLFDLGGAGGLAVRVVPALGTHPVTELRPDQQVQQGDHRDDDDRYHPPPAVGDISPSGEHRGILSREYGVAGEDQPSRVLRER